jgi:hypothetical protein
MAAQDDFEEALGMHAEVEDESNDAAGADGRLAKEKHKSLKKRKGMGNVSLNRLRAK